MRKVYAGLFSSVDGVVEAPNEWQPAFDPERWARLWDACSRGRTRCCSAG